MDYLEYRENKDFPASKATKEANVQHVMLGKKGIKDLWEKMELMDYQVTKDLLEAEEVRGRGGMMDHLACLVSKVQW